jgi:hypothetical protein
MRSELAGTSILYWLDAHWCVADKTAGGASQCPLLEELDAIGDLNPQSLVLIDDARLFLCPPPYPHEIDHWPSFQSVFQKLSSLSREHEIVIANDVIIFFPAKIRQTIESYTYEHSINWLTVLDKSRDYDILLKQLKEKEKELKTAVEKERIIKDLYGVAEERLLEIHKSSASLKEKEQMIENLSGIADERLQEINRLAGNANERLQEINRLTRDAEQRLQVIHEFKSIIEAKEQEIVKWTGIIHEMEQNWGYKLAMKLKELTKRK